ncbi:glutathione ABC transporter substrate-binding protein [Alkalihalobacillus sp. AL-G]|uniref:glutathione ABC transporter substrate-binding protein n=1 Tax=Alkalihalobacillus sp. AL-G TaxID=2926399 RepID=UPI002729609F|nr:glutathione ABC transporter substrate-binding protein [Alkalihalobacillus sp. AL-G]WLD93159.1 glutathione ABC transporter substrate-binding protein [Alkalihalobacillus sp. AL-G]
MKSKRFLTSLITVLLIVSFALAGCSSSGKSSSGGEDDGGDVPQELTYASTTKAVGLSPIETNDSVSSRVIEQIYETLFVRDPETMEIVPKLAKSYENPDPKTWVIKLKEGIKFHDGTDFNAEAVKYTFDKFRDPDTAAPRASLLEPIESIEVKDEYTVVIKTKEPYGPMLAALSHTNASIVSPAADKKGKLNQEPVGTGPFKFVEWAVGDHITLEANKEYWQDPPKLQKVTFKVVPEVNTAVSMLQTGEVQLIDGLTAEHLPRLKSIESVEIMKKEGTPVSYLGFNMSKAPTNELPFRQAVAHAINREAYVKKLSGLGVQSNSIIGPKVFGYDESVEKLGYEYDPEKAKQILKENGYEGATVKMLVANTPTYTKMAEIVQAQLKEVGLDAQIEMMEWGTFLDVSKKGNFDITFLGWTNSTADGSELLYPNLHSDNIGASNRTQYSNPEFDTLVNESRVIVDQEKRKQKLVEANKIAVKDAPWVVMSHGIVTAAYDKSVKGLKMDPTGQWSLYNVHRE